MDKIHIRAFLIMIIFLGMIKYGYAQSVNTFKIGVIDIKKVINTSKYGQEVMAQLQQKYDELSAKIQKKAEELQALKDEIEKKSSLWSQEVKEKKQSEYQKLLRELKSMQEDAQYEMKEYEKKMLDPVFKELEKVIDKFVSTEKYDLILEKNQPGIYYASPEIDITQKIIKLFDEHYATIKQPKK
ncbi:outer membrane chaperone Skp (OmpH) [Thermodesulfobacterium geofontis OPF15]|jgi:outer membrane protein|uniref:Outer membrane chaperone Skp (OmpH) n=1 Tax=Thermodesulfobacterium geofontis (strain OPF15) TaxID=795359 RepID=F8C3X8_THEGP|nr:OmpH family outer membrane protein [Thermodesulfobacterium geofontis]AEH22516.1 outer membrane chaperone Skp (OmpH) [Thermodesulfobacterium geofontis OPF15]